MTKKNSGDVKSGNWRDAIYEKDGEHRIDEIDEVEEATYIKNATVPDMSDIPGGRKKSGLPT